MDAKTKKTLTKFLSAVSENDSPKLFMPFILAAIPCIIIDILTLGIGLIFTSFIWLMLDIESYRYLRTGDTKFICFYHTGIAFKTIYLTSLIRRLILIFSYLCLIIPGIYLSARLSGLSTIILANPTEKNPIRLLQLTYQDSKHQQMSLIVLRLNSFYIIVMTIISFGLIAPWSLPYFRMLRHAHYLHDKHLEYAPKLIANGYDDISPPDYSDDAQFTVMDNSIPSTTSATTADTDNQELNQTNLHSD